MGTKTFRPITPSLRFLVLPDCKELSRTEGRNGGNPRVKPTKALLVPKKRTGGRNNLGRITCRHRGGGAKKHYRIIDFKRTKDGIPATVASIEYDPNRTPYIALLNYADGEKRYIIATKGMKEGQVLLSGPTAPVQVSGNAMALKDMPLGSTVHNIEMIPGRGAQLVRSAGLSAQLMACSGGFATIKMPSGEVRMINDDCRATFGEVSNGEHTLRVEGKAGRKRWMGIRPTVRGTAMNPVDHPLGGGEGRHRGHQAMSPWAVQSKGFRTRTKSKSKKFIVKDRRK